jgi:hypothetical protein
MSGLGLAVLGVTHDRDLFAATNIRVEGRKVAAGAAETEMLVEAAGSRTCPVSRR